MRSHWVILALTFAAASLRPASSDASSSMFGKQAVVQPAAAAFRGLDSFSQNDSIETVQQATTLTRRLMPDPVLTADHKHLQEETLGPVGTYILLERQRNARRNGSGWTPVKWENGPSENLLDPARVREMTELLNQGIRAHLENFVESRGARFAEIFNRYPQILIEVAPHSFKEETYFEWDANGFPRVRIRLDPLVFQPGSETALRGALYETGGWMVHGRMTPQHELTAKTWTALLRDVLLDAFLSAYGHYRIRTGHAPARRLDDIFRADEIDQAEIDRDLRDPELRDRLAYRLEFLVLKILDRIDDKFPGSLQGRRLTPDPVPPREIRSAA